MGAGGSTGRADRGTGAGLKAERCAWCLDWAKFFPENRSKFGAWMGDSSMRNERGRSLIGGGELSRRIGQGALWQRILGNLCRSALHWQNNTVGNSGCIESSSLFGIGTAVKSASPN